MALYDSLASMSGTATELRSPAGMGLLAQSCTDQGTHLARSSGSRLAAVSAGSWRLCPSKTPARLRTSGQRSLSAAPLLGWKSSINRCRSCKQQVKISTLSIARAALHEYVPGLSHKCAGNKC